MEKILELEFIQNYAMAISSILEADVTIIDKELKRIAGTGEYKEKLGEKIPNDSLFGEIILKGYENNIGNCLEKEACLKCEKKNYCKELANIAEPIYLNGEIIGVIGIIAFNKNQKQCLLEKKASLEEFLKYMSLLLESKIQLAMEKNKLEDQIKEVINSQSNEFKRNKYIGMNKKIIEILNLCDKIANSTSTIVITGESGTGKDLLAKYIHSVSNRKDELMISINCGAIPENLVESELFGYEEGAFTGAKKKGHIGKFELANKSTLFLDEIGDMPLHVQKKLLRVLQEQKIERIGGKDSISIDVRVICATNKNLEEMVKNKTFREDLYYRINVIPIEIPALRNRKDDIMNFINYFIKIYNKKLKKNILGVTREAEKLLVGYEWPGNVRELRNIIEYIENILEGSYIDVKDLPSQISKNNGINILNRNLSEIMGEYEKNILQELMKEIKTVEEKDLLAEKLGISRATLYRKLSFYNL
ncbi:sigma-54 interaction domain-containing protein [Fusobacterium sp. MFO224]|uniref:sigma-54 interaction domain-containing protein n=1 Tax=Fusobacterium sp. MFO224 TaxID=3378070 RepID=UPI00385328F6